MFQGLWRDAYRGIDRGFLDQGELGSLNVEGQGGGCSSLQMYDGTRLDQDKGLED